MKNALKITIQIICFISFISCKQKLLIYYEVKLLNNRVSVEIPKTWQNLNNNNMRLDTLNECYYGKEIRGDRVTINYNNDTVKDLEKYLQKEIKEIKGVRQPWCKIINTSIDKKNNIITIETRNEFDNVVYYSKIYEVILANGNYNFFVSGTDTKEFREITNHIINSIKINS